MRKFYFLGIFLMVLLASSCTREDESTTVVETEEVIYVSGEKIRVLGRLITNQPITALDHGFQLSTSESFSNPILISLGEKNGPGRFIGETSGLQINQKYFVRAFINADGADFFGEALEVKTLLPAIESFSPSFSFPGEEMMIVGRNFTPDTRVFFGEQEATVLEIAFDSRLKVRIPEPAGKAKVPLIVQSQDEKLEASQPFEYRTGKYTLVGLFPGNERIYDNVFFQHQNGLFAGLGTDKFGSYLGSLQRFDLQSTTWSKVDFPGETRRGAFATAGYIGGGARVDRDNYYYKRDLWKISGEHFERLPDLPVDSYHSPAFELNGQLHVVGGTGSGLRTLLRYNPATKIWSSLSSAPFDLASTQVSFVYQNKAYLLATDNRIWEYEPTADSWKIFTKFPVSSEGGLGIAQVIGDRVYIGFFFRSMQLMELDLQTLIWKSKTPIPGNPESLNAGHFTYNDQLYLLRCPDRTIPGALPMELYRFDPNGI
ncbi:IPT/TIG domain-containing protein [Algoriphagus sp. A40]|uniref:IPT/TIG domain-containing protein n=1 Tax=Algoriphagus sp. A40 TaxID=1945863 RepID=UPI000987B669|nr:IPT/TIG domain-containing protein [Algoriphagus sp. A40]OOG74339.1 hypothetical protein B0E43_12100 [Algoriphagus sp. A40]